MITLLLIAINVLVYAILAYKSGNFLEIDIEYMKILGISKGSFLSGNYYQIISSFFVHFDLPHLGYNMVFLGIFGFKAEKLYGKKLFLLIYFVSGMLSSLVCFFYPDFALFAGASGAIFGILGAVLIAQRNVYPQGVYTSLYYAFVFFILAATTGFISHLLGLVIGFLLGYMITKDWYPEEVGEIEEDVEKSF